MIGGGPFGLDPGQWTDDTSLALCLAESLIDTQGFDPADQLERYLMWYHEGYWSSNGKCFDIGATTEDALIRFETNGDTASGGLNDRSAGNGSIMRLAPVPLYYCGSPAEAIHFSGESSRTTHGLPVCIDACRYLSALILGALKGDSKDRILSDHYAPIHDAWGHVPLHTDIAEIASGSFKHKQPPDIRGSGYVVNSLEAALWAFHNSDSFEEGCLLAVNLGEDADTTAAVYGQLAGAYYGASGISAKWLSKLARREEIENMANSLVDG